MRSLIRTYMPEDLSRREVIEGFLAGALFSRCNEDEGLETADTAVDTAQDRWSMLVNAALVEDVDTLMDMTQEEFDALRADPDLPAVVPDYFHILYTAKWWGYMKDQARKAQKPFELPNVVRTSLHWKAPVDSNERVTADDFPHY